MTQSYAEKATLRLPLCYSAVTSAVISALLCGCLCELCGCLCATLRLPLYNSAVKQKQVTGNAPEKKPEKTRCGWSGGFQEFLKNYLFETCVFCKIV